MNFNIYVCHFLQENNRSDWFGFLGNIVGAFLGALISGIIAVNIFNKGIQKEKEKGEAKTSIKRKSFFILLNAIVKKCNVQIEEYEKYISAVKANPYENFIPLQFTHEEIDRIRSFDISDVLLFFNSKGLAEDDYIKWLKNIDYLYAVLKQIPKDIESILDNEIRMLFSKNIETTNEILTICTDSLQQLIEKKDIEKNNLSKFLDNLLTNYFKTKETNLGIENDLDNLINPLKKAFLDEFKNYPFSLPILKLAKRGGDIIYTIKEFNLHFCKSLEITKEHILESIKELEEINKKTIHNKYNK